MKKLRLNVTNLGATEILSREELKKVLGGTDYGSGTCGAYVPNSANGGAGALAGSGSTFTGGSGYVTTEVTVYKEVSKQFALDITNGISGAKWCCDSCGSTDWYTNDPV